MNSRRYDNMNDEDPPMLKTVSGMPWIDSDGDTGFYTGDVNASNLPDGMGMMRYDDGPVVRGRWQEGEMVVEEEELKSNSQQQQQQQQSTNNDGDMKQRQLQQFHERNQQFLQSTQQSQYQQSQEEMEYQQEQEQQQQLQQHIQQQQQQKQQLQQQREQQQHQQQQHQQQQQQQHQHRAETQHLHEEIYALQEEVQQLRHELRITQDTHQLSKDQSRAAISMLHSEADRQTSRHEQIVASFRNRLVESETARMKMQDQLSNRMEEDATREDELKSRWKAMTTRVLEDKKWVDEQMNYWKESMEEHRKRLSGAKVRGGLDARLGTATDGSSPSRSGGKSRSSIKSSGSESDETKNRRLSQRRLWGAHVEGDEEESDEEEVRMFGKSNRS